MRRRAFALAVLAAACGDDDMSFSRRPEARFNRGRITNPAPSVAQQFNLGSINAASPQANWFRHNGSGVFLPWNTIDPVPVQYHKHAAHCEVWVQTAPSFGGTFTIRAVPSNTNVDASGVSIWVDDVYNQTVLFDVSAPALDKTQTRVVDVGVSGAHVIRIQEGERDPGVPLTGITIAGDIIPRPPISRSYTAFGDSVEMGAWAIPRSLGWAQRMKAPGGSRFDSVSNLGQSGYSLSQATFGAGGVAQCAIDLVPADAAYRGSVENRVAMCLSLNDWNPSAASTTAATYKASLLAVVDAAKARADSFGVPGFWIMLHGPTRTLTGLAAVNDKGSTLGAFDTAIQEVAAMRPTFTTYVSLFDACADADMHGDNVHPWAEGHAKIHAAVLAAT